MPVVVRVLLGCGCLSLFVIAGLVVVGFGVVDTVQRREREQCVAGAMESLGPGSERIAEFHCTEILRPENADLARWIGRSGAEGSQLAGAMAVDDATLATLFDIRHAIADASVEACANQWDVSAPDAATRALVALPDAELRRFAVATVGLLRGAMAGTVRMSAAEAEVVFVDFVSGVQNGPTGGAIAAANATPGDPALACGATRSLFAALEAMPPADRLRTERAWLVFEAAPVQ